MKKIFFLTAVVLGIVALSASWRIASAQTWTAPLLAPPSGNTLPPINVGPVQQEKVGPLILKNSNANVQTLILRNTDGRGAIQATDLQNRPRFQINTAQDGSWRLYDFAGGVFESIWSRGGKIGIGGNFTTLAESLEIRGALRLVPIGTSAGTHSNASNPGTIRYNTNTGDLEGYTAEPSASWKSLTVGALPICSEGQTLKSVSGTWTCSDGGAGWKQYTTTLGPGTAQWQVFNIPNAIMDDYCRDENGCKVAVGMRNWNSSNQGQTLISDQAGYLVLSRTGGNQWRYSVTYGTDASANIYGGGEEQVFNQNLQNYGNCIFSDADTVDASGNRRDTQVGWSLLKNGGTTNSSLSCLLILTD